MENSYNPVGCSPEDFCKVFVEKFEEWSDYGFYRERPGDPRIKLNSESTEFVSYFNGEHIYANVRVHPFRVRRIFSKEKIKDIGSVIIASQLSEYVELVLTDLQKLTGVTLERVRGVDKS